MLSMRSLTPSPQKMALKREPEKMESATHTVEQTTLALRSPLSPRAPPPSTPKRLGPLTLLIPQLSFGWSVEATLPRKEAQSPSEATLPRMEAQSLSEPTLPRKEAQSLSERTLPRKEPQSPLEVTLPRKEAQTPSEPTLPRKEPQSPSDSTRQGLERELEHTRERIAELVAADEQHCARIAQLESALAAQSRRSEQSAADAAAAGETARVAAAQLRATMRRSDAEVAKAHALAASAWKEVDAIKGRTARGHASALKKAEAAVDARVRGEMRKSMAAEQATWKAEQARQLDTASTEVSTACHARILRCAHAVYARPHSRPVAGHGRPHLAQHAHYALTLLPCGTQLLAAIGTMLQVAETAGNQAEGGQSEEASAEGGASAGPVVARVEAAREEAESMVAVQRVHAVVLEREVEVIVEQLAAADAELHHERRARTSATSAAQLMASRCAAATQESAELRELLEAERAQFASARAEQSADTQRAMQAAQAARGEMSEERRVTKAQVAELQRKNEQLNAQLQHRVWTRDATRTADPTDRSTLPFSVIERRILQTQSPDRPLELMLQEARCSFTDASIRESSGPQSISRTPSATATTSSSAGSQESSPPGGDLGADAPIQAMDHFALAGQAPSGPPLSPRTKAPSEPPLSPRAKTSKERALGWKPWGWQAFIFRGSRSRSEVRADELHSSWI